jgi:hypothetical protein
MKFAVGALLATLLVVSIWMTQRLSRKYELARGARNIVPQPWLLGWILQDAPFLFANICLYPISAVIKFVGVGAIDLLLRLAVDRARSKNGATSLAFFFVLAFQGLFAFALIWYPPLIVARERLP